MSIKRMQFIPEIRDRIVASVRAQADVPEVSIELAITSWEEGCDPNTPLEQGVFKVCELFENEVNEHWRKKQEAGFVKLDTLSILIALATVAAVLLNGCAS